MKLGSVGEIGMWQRFDIKEQFIYSVLYNKYFGINNYFYKNPCV